MPSDVSRTGPTRAPLLALTLAAAAVRATWLMRSTEPSGWDGYYYVAQATHLATEGHFHVADHSWVLYLLSLPRLLGADATTGIKLVAAALAALCVPAAYALGKQIDERRAWWLAFWAAGSPALTHLAGDFPKNLGAAAPLLFGLAFAEHRIVALAMAALAGQAHRLGAALALAAAPGASRKRWAVLALPLGAAALALWPPTRAMLSEAFTLHPSWPPPPWAYFALRPTSWPEIVELSLAVPALAAAAISWRKREHRGLIASLALPLVACALPLWRTDTLDLGYRLALMAPLFAVPLLVIAAPKLPRPHPVIALAALALAVTGFDPSATPDYARYRAVIAKIPRPLPELVIAHQGITFLYDVETGHEALGWAPDAAMDRTHVYRLAWGIRDGEWLRYAPGDEAVRLDSDYVYVREDVWERFVAAAHDDDELEARLRDYRNPSRVRPGH